MAMFFEITLFLVHPVCTYIGFLCIYHYLEVLENKAKD